MTDPVVDANDHDSNAITSMYTSIFPFPLTRTISAKYSIIDNLI